MEIALSLLLVVIVPAVLIYMLVMLEPFAITRPRLIVVSLLWGAVSFLAADALQSNELDDLKISEEARSSESEETRSVEEELKAYSISIPLIAVSLYSAPLLEEFLKMAFLLVIYNRTFARYAGDGLVYGFAVGSGFGMIENLAYTLGQQDQALSIALARIVSTGLFHASLTGLLGAGVCGLIYYRRSFTYPIFIVLFLFAVIAHHMFNIYALVEVFVGEVSTSIFLGILLLVIVIGLQYFIRFRENRRIAHDLHNELDATQLMLVHHGSAVVGDLDKQSERFGAEQEKLLRDYLVGEAQMALLTQRIIKGRGHRPNIQKLRTELHDLRNRVLGLKQQLSPDARDWLNQERKKLA